MNEFKIVVYILDNGKFLFSPNQVLSKTQQKEIDLACQKWLNEDGIFILFPFPVEVIDLRPNNRVSSAITYDDAHKVKYVGDLVGAAMASSATKKE